MIGRRSADDRPGAVDIEVCLDQSGRRTMSPMADRPPGGTLTATVGYLPDAQKDSRRRGNYKCAVKSSRCLKLPLPMPNFNPAIGRTSPGCRPISAKNSSGTRRELIGMLM